jgi:hypothetical protein
MSTTIPVYYADPFPGMSNAEIIAAGKAMDAKAIAEGRRVPPWAEWDEERGRWNVEWDGQAWVARGPHQAPAGARQTAPAIHRREPAAKAAPISARELRRVAYHEGAHVVVARLAGYPVTRVEVGEPNDFGGHGLTTVDWDAGGAALLALEHVAPGLTSEERAALVFLAGRAGDELAGSPQSQAGRVDGAKALARVRPLHSTDDAAREHVAELSDVARRLVFTGLIGTAVRWVAEALEERRSLTGEDVAALLSPIGWMR